MTRNDSKWIHMHPFDSFNKTINKIRRFSNLESGWRYGEGVPPNQDVVNRAIELIEKSIQSSFNKTDATPQIDGGIELTISHNNFTLEIHLEPDDTITYYKMRDNVDIEPQDSINLENLHFKIRQFWNETCLPSGSSSLTNISNMNQDFQAPHSIHPQAMVEFPSLTGTAYPDVLEQPFRERLTGT